MNFEDEPPHNYCNECDTEFEDSFQLVDHVLEDDEEFDPFLLLPNGVKLLFGSFLRSLPFKNNCPSPGKIVVDTFD